MIENTVIPYNQGQVNLDFTENTVVREPLKTGVYRLVSTKSVLFKKELKWKVIE